jgi:glycosyltransferase involved in cell wall biosynthesis
MKTFAILIEPASYTIDRNKKVYEPKKIEYCYLKNSSEASNITSDATCLEGLSLRKKIKFLNAVLKNNDNIIMNGYVNIEFVILFFLNFFYKKPIGIDSDTQYSVPKNKLKQIFKQIYLNTIFRNKHIFGLAGGSKSHVALFSNFGMPNSRIFLMPMMVDNDKFENVSYQKKQMEPFNFLYVGRLVEHKNIRMLLSAFDTISKKYSFAKLLIAGNGTLLQEMQSYYSNNKSIVFLGPQYNDELLEVYQRGHLLILPSAYEPWGLVVNEALSSGIPVIVSDKVGAAFDLVETPKTGFVFNSEDINELTTCMETILNNESLYKELAYNAYTHMKKQWNFDLYSNCLDNLLIAMGKHS